MSWAEGDDGGVAAEVRAYVVQQPVGQFNLVEEGAERSPTVTVAGSSRERARSREEPGAASERREEPGAASASAARAAATQGVAAGDTAGAAARQLRALSALSAPPAPRRQCDAAGAEARSESRLRTSKLAKLDATLTATPSTVPAPRARRAGSPAWASALIVFAGPGHDADLAARLRARGVAVTVVDTKVGGGQHDVRRPAVGERLIGRVRRGDYDVVFGAPPCESYSVAHRPQLRSRKQPSGLQNAPPEWSAYLRKHNELAEWTVRLARAAHEAGALWAVENPADRGDESSPAHWERFADHAPLWKQPCVEALVAETGARVRTFAYCAFAAPYQKWTSIAHAEEWSELAALDERLCDHGKEPHGEQLHGRHASGLSRATSAAAYPDEMNEFLAEAATRALRRREAERAAAREREAGAASERASATPGAARGGLVGEGWELSPTVAAACEAARHTPPKFASVRNQRAAAASALRREALPGDLHAPPPSTKPRGAAERKRAERQRRAAAQAASRGERAAAALARERRLAEGPVRVHELYDAGVYEGTVQPWLQQADAAAAALREGRTPPKVPTVTIEQDQMPLWARGVVWDCSDPADCKPVQRSTRDTVFPGARQIDRAALRAAAEELGWERVDLDILEQIGEGGVEARSDCALTTVLAWHHNGVAENVAAAAKVVQADWAEEWASRPTRHLPFAPCRILPRNVIMQERVRLLPGEGADGAPRLEAYEKPRITQNSSHGGVDSVNAGVDDDDSFVQLPTVQRFARGWAICDTAGEAGGARAAGYVVDAESAYRFCVVQLADQWTQCFAWWDDEGRVGFCVDRRLGFGGAYAPNRFERISTLVAAYAQHMQRGFDEVQPPPPSARRWAEERRARQGRGQLPDGEAQLAPKYLQVFIDDFTGAALDDTVEPPASVAGIDIDPRNALSLGARPASSSSRVYVHAQLVVLALRRLGLSAAPGKVVVANPVVALGFEVARGEELGQGRVRCPELKRQAMRREAAEALAAAAEARVDRRKAERLVGRLCNISQVLPELKGPLGGGYAVTRATWEVGGARRRPPKLQLRQGGSVQAEWMELLRLAEDLLQANEGVALAPEAAFQERAEPGALTVVTDASGVDGVGGYALDPANPGEALLVSELWPADVLAALQRQALRASERERGPDAALGRLSMPAAEAFGQWAVAEAHAVAAGRRPTAVTAVGDCDPAAAALNAGASGRPQMRRLVRGARELCAHWLAVSVSRDLNLDADRLSHPARLAEVRADAQAAGVATRVAPIPQHCWAALRAAISVEAETRRAPRKRKAASER